MQYRKQPAEHYRLLCGGDISETALADFYRRMYPRRPSVLGDIWPWLYRSAEYGSSIPKIVLNEETVVGHAGLIPFHAVTAGKRYTAAWFVDFVVDATRRRQGIGQLLTRDWADFADIFLALGCNEKSMGVFKKCGWKEAFDSYFHYLHIPCRKVRNVGGVRYALRSILNRLSILTYRKYAFPVSRICMEDINSTSLAIFKTLSISDENTLSVVRDDRYRNWRILDSPYNDQYGIFRVRGVDDFAMVVKLCRSGDHKGHIDVLWVSDPRRHYVVRAFLANLAIWGAAGDYATICFYTTDRRLSQLLRRSFGGIVKHPRFAYFSRDPELMARLGHSRWILELIDNDFEFINSTHRAPRITSKCLASDWMRRQLRWRQIDLQQ